MFSIYGSAVLFDFDGVLADSTPAVIRHWTAFATRNQLNVASVLEVAHGRPAIEVIKLAVGDLEIDVEFEHEWFDRLEADDVSDVFALPGAIDSYNAVPPEKRAIVTSATRTVALARIRAAGIDEPKVLVSASDVRYGKPSPEAYLAAAEILKVSISDSIVFEDSQPGIDAAVNAGALCVALTTTHDEAELFGQKHTVRDLSAVKIASQREGIEVVVGQ